MTTSLPFTTKKALPKECLSKIMAILNYFTSAFKASVNAGTILFKSPTIP